MKWCNEKIAYLVEHYANRKNSELAKAIGTTEGAVSNKANKLKLKKSREFIEKHCNRFKTGLVPHNKGKPMPEATKAKLKTMFKKGHKPQNKLEVGTERICRDGYTYVKVSDSPNKWVAKHHILWGQDVPKGYKLVFIDGNKRNFDISNFQLISDAEQMKKNTIKRFPQELQNLIRTLKKLERSL